MSSNLQPIRYPAAFDEHNSAKNNAIAAFKAMTKSMEEMGAEHARYQENATEVQERLEDLKNTKHDFCAVDVEIVVKTNMVAHL